MKPSREAIELNSAIAAYRAAEGTPNQFVALASLEAVVRRVKAQQQRRAL
jgi:hypothetical protein